MTDKKMVKFTEELDQAQAMDLVSTAKQIQQKLNMANAKAAQVMGITHKRYENLRYIWSSGLKGVIPTTMSAKVANRFVILINHCNAKKHNETLSPFTPVKKDKAEKKDQAVATTSSSGTPAFQILLKRLGAKKLAVMLATVGKSIEPYLSEMSDKELLNLL